MEQRVLDFNWVQEVLVGAPPEVLCWHHPYCLVLVKHRRMSQHDWKIVDWNLNHQLKVFFKFLNCKTRLTWFCLNLKERETIARKSHAAVSQLSELRNLTETMKEENEKLASSWKTLAEVSIQEVAFRKVQMIGDHYIAMKVRLFSPICTHIGQFRGINLCRT